MNSRRVLPLGLALSALALAAPQRYEMRSYVQVGSKVQPAFAWCDAPDRVLAVTDPGSPRPASITQPTTLLRWLKRPQPQSDTDPLTARYLLGPSEGAAGSIYTRLSFPDSPGADSRFFIRTSNVENVQDPAYRMTRVNEFRTPEGSFPCRYVPQAVFMGATSKRTVIVWEDGETATYRALNFNGTAGTRVTGGYLLHAADSFQVDGGHNFSRWYVWNAPGGYSYKLSLSQSGATLQVRKGEKVLQTEPFLAYSVRLPAGARP